MVFHAGFYGKMDRETSYLNIKKAVLDILEEIRKNKWNKSGSIYSYTMDVHDLLLHPPYTEHQLQDLQHDSSKHRLEDFSIIDLHNCLSCF